MTTKKKKLAIVADCADQILLELAKRHDRAKVLEAKARLEQVIQSEFSQLPAGTIALAVGFLRDCMIFSMIE